MIRVFRDGLQKLLRSGGVGSIFPASVGHMMSGSIPEFARVANQWTGNVFGTAAINKDIIYATPFLSPARGGLLYTVQTRFGAIAAGNVRLGVYANVADERDMYPGELLFDSGSITLVASTDLFAVCQLNLDPLRYYWIAWIVDVNQAAASTRGSGTAPGGGQELGVLATSGTAFNESLSVANAYGAFPDPFPASATWGTVAPAVRARYGA